MIEYQLTVNFHKSWARAHHDITEEASQKFDSNELQTVGDLVNIQNKRLALQPEYSNELFSLLMVYCALVGLMFIPLLFYSYFFDVPYFISSLEVLGPLSILVCWAGLFFLIWKWKGNSTMTFSQHAAQKREAILYYIALWVVVLPPFVWFMLNPFADKIELGLLFKLLTMLSSLGMLGAAIIPETKGWKILVHRFSAYLMAYLLCPIVLLTLFQGEISTFARITLLSIGVFMLYGLVRSVIEKRQHSEKSLLYQASYVVLFHACILVAYYL